MWDKARQALANLVKEEKVKVNILNKGCRTNKGSVSQNVTIRSFSALRAHCGGIRTGAAGLYRSAARQLPGESCRRI